MNQRGLRPPSNRWKHNVKRKTKSKQKDAGGRGKKRKANSRSTAHQPCTEAFCCATFDIQRGHHWMPWLVHSATKSFRTPLLPSWSRTRPFGSQARRQPVCLEPENQMGELHRHMLIAPHSPATENWRPLPVRSLAEASPLGMQRLLFCSRKDSNSHEPGPNLECLGPPLARWHCMPRWLSTVKWRGAKGLRWSALHWARRLR
ncbi:hypothetical protein B0T16DRAFT_214044 [Cercophora newfieldiana]|uniref:Uncharacterized protein n=1 Tax=Cercophora newfieldiana TaxID=92897 RepID=A0AA39XWF1_9PEZI|nr:hypothetical protein B0T16DRAFT_214044 [Cercophora newfieldiana]